MNAPPISNTPAKPPRRSYRTILLLCCATPLAVFTYLGFTRIPPRDVDLIAGFRAHHAAYEHLREMIQSEDRLRAITRWGVSTTDGFNRASPRLANFSEERYKDYLVLLKEVGGYYAVRQPGEPADLEIQLWRWGFAGFGGNIGICWKHQPPATCSPGSRIMFAGATEYARSDIGISRETGTSGQTCENSSPARSLNGGFDCMRACTILVVGFTLVLTFTGCVPLAHRSLLAPPASGQAADMETLKPIAQASVVRHIEAVAPTSTAITDDKGSFHFEKNSRLLWLAGCRVARAIEYCVSAQGYTPFQTNLCGGGDFYRGTVPHDLGRILLLRIPK
jgi:hypothetical protein